MPGRVRRKGHVDRKSLPTYDHNNTGCTNINLSAGRRLAGREGSIPRVEGHDLRRRDGKTVRKYERIEQWVRSNIAERRIVPGDRLPSENELCGMFSVSRNVVRQALTNLVHEGLLETVKGVGTFCRSPLGGRTLSTNIAFVCFFTGSYIFPELIRGCDHVLYRKGFHLLINQSEYDVGKERRILLALERKGIDGVIVEPVYSGEAPRSSNSDLLEEMRSQGIAVVLCDNYYPEAEFSSVRLDDYEGGRGAARYLWEHGHRRIAVFYQCDYQVKQARRRGVESWLEARGAPIPPQWRIPFTGQGHRSAASETAARFFEETTALPSAVVCSSDEDALHFMREAERHGLVLPDDLSVISFDNSQVAQLEKIGLTSVEHPSFYMGEAATNMLLEQIYHPELRIVDRRVIVPKIVERISVRAL